MKFENLFPSTFNPEDVDIRLQYISVDKLEQMIETGKLSIPKEEELQRLSNSWINKERSSFIESILANLPIQLIYLDGSKSSWRIIDGVQRIITIHKFMKDEFTLNGLEYFKKECEGQTFSSIPFYLRSRIESTNLIAYIINPGTPEEVKFNIFKRIGRTGTQRNREEIRNNFFYEKASTCINQLAESPEFLQATHHLVSPKGMSDRELVCRFFTFKFLFNIYESADSIDDFLDKGMNILDNKTTEQLNEETNHFKTTMKRCYMLLHDMSFINLNIKGKQKKRINKTLFDIFSHAISELNESEFLNLSQQVNLFRKEYFKLFEDEGFLSSSKLRKNSQNAVIERFERMNIFVKQFIN